MTESERRAAETQATWELKRKLNVVQLAALNSLESFGWYLKFVRHNPPAPPVGVLCDPDTHAYALLDAEGELHENPVFEKFRAPEDR